MKYLIFLIFFMPNLVSAQTQADYEHAIDKFVRFYNNKQADSIINMWSARDREHPNRMWSAESVISLHEKYGKILLYKYIGIDSDDPNPGLAVFKTQFSVANWKTTSLTLDKENHLGTFRFITSSDGINKLLEKSK